MKTLKLLASILFVTITSFQLNAQEYFNETSFWRWIYVEDGMGYDATEIIHQLRGIDNVVFNNEDYVKFLYTEKVSLIDGDGYTVNDVLDFQKEIFLRQDGKQIYRRSEDGSDFLLYDFDLNVGDTLHRFDCIEEFGYGSINNYDVLTIDSISTILFLGQERKLYWVDATNPGQRPIYEGIGSSDQFLCPTFDSFETYSSLRCYHQDGEYLDIPIWGLDDATCEGYLTNQQDLSFSNLKVFPNPTGESLHISLDRNLEKYSIFNNTGQLIRDVKNNVSIHENTLDFEINISDLSKGIYFLKFQTIGGQQVEKIIKM